MALVFVSFIFNVRLMITLVYSLYLIFESSSFCLDLPTFKTKLYEFSFEMSKPSLSRFYMTNISS